MVKISTVIFLTGSDFVQIYINYVIIFIAYIFEKVGKKEDIIHFGPVEANY